LNSNELKIKIFADGADLAGIRMLRQNPVVKGFTTNPTLMKQSGITDYLGFSQEVVDVIDGLPISLEVFSDDFVEMNRQALKLAALGPNVYVKIPITNTKGDSIFAGRIADAGIDPIPTMQKALELMRPHPQIELIWASPREVLNVVQGDQIGCHIITVTHDLIKKLSSLGKDLEQFSIETVQMFANDALKAGFNL
jgi:transaldolase